MSFDLNRFLEAQSKEFDGYETALREIKSGKKGGHWIWYIFPQLKKLGKSSNAQYYGIDGIEEAIAYASEPVLWERLLEISQALLNLSETNPEIILGQPDDKKVKSCMTLFLSVEPNNEVFQAVIDKFYMGNLDGATLKILEANYSNASAGK